MSNKLDPRIIRTRRLIEDAFFDLYQTKRIKDITVRDIATAAGVNRATFYRHYQDKFDLYDAVVQRCFEEHLATMLAPDAAMTEETFHSLVLATMTFIIGWRSGRRIVTEPTDHIIETRVQQTVLDRIMYWIEPNYMKGLCDSGTEVAGTAVSWAVFGVAIRMVEQNASAMVEAAAGELVRMLAGGLWNTLVDYATHMPEAS